MQRYISYNLQNKSNARTLRSTMTNAEILLWSKIRKKQVCDIQFYRQKPIAHYIVDFYAPAIKLVIELDGGQHFEEKHMKYDQERDHYLEKIGITVLRFTNDQLFKEFDSVMDVIFHATTHKKENL